MSVENIRSIEAILRKIPTKEYVLRGERRVNVFRAVDCIMALSKHEMSSESIKGAVQELLRSSKIQKVRVQNKGTDRVDLQAGKVLSASDLYIWTEEKTNYMAIVIAVLIIMGIFMIVMFQMWPMWLKRMVSYIRYPIFAFIGFLAVMAIVRIVVFGITYFSHPPGLWVLPNLFADCGFFESFVPAYSWANENVSHKKKNGE